MAFTRKRSRHRRRRWAKPEPNQTDPKSSPQEIKAETEEVDRQASTLALFNPVEDEHLLLKQATATTSDQDTVPRRFTFFDRPEDEHELLIRAME